MADGMRQYEIVFMMKAALDSSMQELSATGGRLKELEEAVQNYQRTLGAIDAYKVHAGAVQELEAKQVGLADRIRENNAVFDAATAAVRETDRSVRGHEAQVRALTDALQEQKTARATLKVLDTERAQRIKELQAVEADESVKIREIGAALQDERAKIEALNAALKEEGADTQKINAEIAAHKAKIDELNAALQTETAARDRTKTQIQEEGTARAALTTELARNKEQQEQIKQELGKERQALQESKAALKEKTAAEQAALKEKNALQKSSDQLREKIQGEKTAMQEAAGALDRMGVGTADLDQKAASLREELAQTNKELEKTAAQRNAFIDLANSATVFRSALETIRPAAEGAFRFFRGSVDIAADLEHTLSSAEAVSGATEAEMVRLTAIVKEMGATTRYTAMDAATAMKQMALAGWETDGMMSALPGVVHLAAAADEDLAAMTQIVVDGMNALNMSGTADAQKFADVLAKAATSSSTSVAQLGNALEACQGTAGNLGYTIEDVATVLAGMADNGVKASVAGTALNTLLTRLSGGVQAAEKQMQELGVSMYDAATGEARPLLEVIGDLREAFKGFGDDAKGAQTAAYTLAGMRGMKGLLSITNMSDEAWAKLCQDVSMYGGAAERIAGISMDNYTGQIYLLTSAWDALRTSVGEHFLPMATGTARVLTGLTTGLDQLAQKNGAVVRFLGGTTWAFLGLSTAAAGLAGAVQVLSFAMNTLKISALLGVGGAVGALAAAAAAVGVAVAVLGQKEHEATAAAKEMVRSHEEAIASFEETAGAIEKERRGTEALLSELDALSAKEEKSAFDKERIARICKELNGTLPDLAIAYDKEADKISGVNESLDQYAERVYEAKRREADAAQASALYASMRETEEAIADAKQELERWERALEEKKANGANASIADFFNFADPRFDISQEANEVHDYQEIIRGLTQDLGDLKEQYDALVGGASGGMGMEEAASGVEVLDTALEGAKDRLAQLADPYQKALDAARESVQGQYKLWEEAAEIEAKSVQAASDAIQSQTEQWRQYDEDLRYLQTLTPEIDGLGNALAELADGSADSMGMVRSMADEARAGSGKVYEMAQSYQELRSAQERASETMAEVASQVEIKTAEMVEDIRQAVQDMRQEGLAAESAQTTMDAFLSAIGSYEGPAAAAASRVGEAAAAALSAKLSAMDATVSAAVSRANATVSRTVGSLNARVEAASASAAKQGGYASGTDHAPPGVALVGERGPELLLFRGGEQVLTATETRRIFQETERLRAAAPELFQPRTGAGDAGARNGFLSDLARVRQIQAALRESGPAAVLPAYASGADHALPGPALVGERGPELLLMAGRDALPADETIRIFRQAARVVPQTPDVGPDVGRSTGPGERSAVLREIRDLRECREIQETEKIVREARDRVRGKYDPGVVFGIVLEAQDRERAPHMAHTDGEIGRTVRQMETARISKTFRETEKARISVETVLRSMREVRETERIFRDTETMQRADLSVRAAQDREQDLRIREGIGEGKTDRAVREMEDAVRISRVVREVRERIFREAGDAGIGGGCGSPGQIPGRALREMIRAEELAARDRARPAWDPIPGDPIQDGIGPGTGPRRGPDGVRLDQDPVPAPFDAREAQGAWGGGPERHERRDGDGPPVQIQVTYNVEAGTDTNGLRDALRANDRELEALIRRTLRRVREDESRRAYA